MARDKKRNKYIHRPLGLRIAGCIMVVSIAAVVCGYGCFYIILKGPFKSYRADFVKHICNETRCGFVVEKILGKEETQSLLGLPMEEPAVEEQNGQTEGEAKE